MWVLRVVAAILIMASGCSFSRPFGAEQAAVPAVNRNSETTEVGHSSTVGAKSTVAAGDGEPSILETTRDAVLFVPVGIVVGVASPFMFVWWVCQGCPD